MWFDAVIGYLSAAVEWAHVVGRPDAWREWWQNPESRHYYFQGKDNIVFHTVIWPSILTGYEEGGELGAGRGPLQLPYDVVASEFLTMEGRKFAASRGVGILIRDFLERYEPDALRYYLTAAGPETQDTDFTWSEFVRRTNDELVATWGNLANRVLTIAHKHFGSVPEPGALLERDAALLAEIDGGFATVGALIEDARFKAALGEAMQLARRVNQYVNDEAPWALVKDDRERAAAVLSTCLRAVDSLKTIFAPFLPFSSQRLHELLGHDGFLAGPLELREVAEEDDRHVVLTGDYASWIGAWAPSNLATGQALREPAPLFRKLEESVVDEELERMRQASAAA